MKEAEKKPVRKPRTCPKAKGYGKPAQTILTDAWDTSNLKVDYKTAKDKASLQCSYQRPLAAEGAWNEGKFVLRTNDATLTFEPGKSVEVQLLAPAAAPNFLSEAFPGLTLTSGVVFAETQRSRKVYVRSKYAAAPGLQLGGQLSFSPVQHEADHWHEQSRQGVVLLNEAKLTASYSAAAVNVAAALNGLSSVSVDFACAPAEAVALYRERVQGEEGALPPPALADVYVGGNTTYSFRTAALGSTTLAAMCQAGGGFASLAVYLFPLLGKLALH